MFVIEGEEPWARDVAQSTRAEEVTTRVDSARCTTSGSDATGTPNPTFPRRAAAHRLDVRSPTARTWSRRAVGAMAITCAGSAPAMSAPRCHCSDGPSPSSSKTTKSCTMSTGTRWTTGRRTSNCGRPCNQKGNDSRTRSTGRLRSSIAMHPRCSATRDSETQQDDTKCSGVTLSSREGI